ncbi:MAG: DUF454 family protein [Anaerolineae bacterium]|nr:YbaN family protein [Thermoflexales bacterium]MDW8395852.1 DUF454 family protein [Anaerolineae bacterium]
MRSKVERFFEKALHELRYHTNPANHQPLEIRQVTHPVHRTLLLVAGVAFLGLGGLGAVTPVMPTWPFVLVALFCFARSSARVREWVSHNRVILSVVSLVRSRPERPFVWAWRCIQWVTGCQPQGERSTSWISKIKFGDGRGDTAGDRALS